MPDRYDFMPSQATLQTAQGVNELRHDVSELRRVLAAFVLDAVRGQAADLTAEPYRSFFSLPEGLDQQAALARALEIAAPSLGKVNCPECGSVVEDLAGKTNEQCVFCGHVLSTSA